MFDNIKASTRAAMLAVATVSVLVTGASAQSLQIDPGKFNILPHGNLKVPEDRILRVACPDPSAVEIGLANIRARRGASGTFFEFDVVGTIRNVGAGAWSSGRGQQVASLKRTGATLASRDFTRLSPGDGFTLTGRMSVHAAEEFPPNLELSISYDPDIRIDGNPANDDCRMGNNSRRLSGSELMNRLRAGH
jgi:hypothetical protein